MASVVILLYSVEIMSGISCYDNKLRQEWIVPLQSYKSKALPGGYIV